MTQRLSVQDLPHKYQEQVSAQIHGHAVHRAVNPAKPVVRQKASGMNRLEASFHDYLKSLKTYSWIYPQSVTLLLANGVRYTPDFVCARFLSDSCGFVFVAYETKGFMRDDAGVKIKCAATMFPWIEFHLVTRKKGQWVIQKIEQGPVTP